jgi:4-amino-4-deoxy-L-arabinose transferase-like glycosyltransferase
MQSLPNIEGNNEQDEGEERRLRKRSLWRRSLVERELFVVCLLVFGASITTIISSQDAIHFALTWSLATARTIWLDSNVYSGQLYTVQLAGHTYSGLPPGLAFFTFSIVSIAQMITPMDPSASGVYIATYFSCIFGALAAVLFFKTARMFGSERASAYLTFVFAFGSSLWIYSRIYLPDALATCLELASVYFLLRAHQACVVAAREQVLDNRDHNWRLRLKKEETTGNVTVLTFLSGLFLGLTVFVDNMAIFFAVPLFLYLAFEIWPPQATAKLATIFSFLIGAFIGFIPILGYDLTITGDSFKAPYGDPFIGGVPSSSYTFNLGHGLYQALLSPASGLLLFTPFVFVSFFGLFYLWKERRSETLFLFGLFLSILLPVSLVTSSAYFFRTVIGPSELIISVPYILLPAISVLNRMKQISLASVFTYILGAASILMTGIIALTDPVLGPSGAVSGVSGPSPLLSINIPLFLDHSFLTWWSFFNNSIIYAILVVAFPLVLFSYWAFVGTVRIGRQQLKELRAIGLQATARFGKSFKALLTVTEKIFIWSLIHIRKSISKD